MSDPDREPSPWARLDDPEWLREQYWAEERTLDDIADELGVHRSTVMRRMEEHGIDRRRKGGSPI